MCRGHRNINNLGTVDKRRQKLGSAFQGPCPNDNGGTFTDDMFQCGSQLDRLMSNKDRHAVSMPQTCGSELHSVRDGMEAGRRVM